MIMHTLFREESYVREQREKIQKLTQKKKRRFYKSRKMADKYMISSQIGLTYFCASHFITYYYDLNLYNIEILLITTFGSFGVIALCYSFIKNTKHFYAYCEELGLTDGSVPSTDVK